MCLDQKEEAVKCHGSRSPLFLNAQANSHSPSLILNFEAQNTPSEPRLTPLIYGFSCRNLPKDLLIQGLINLMGNIEGLLMGQSEALRRSPGWAK